MRISIILIFVMLLTGIPCFSGPGKICTFRTEIIPAPGTAEFISRGIPGKNIKGYWLYLPEKYNRSAEWPILVFLHGGGAGPKPDINRLKRFGPLKNVLKEGLSSRSAGTIRDPELHSALSCQDQKG